VPKKPELDIENQEFVEAYEQCLRVHKAEFLDRCHVIAEKYGEAGKLKLGGHTWPLRPLFLDRKQMDFICASLFKQLESCRDSLLELFRSKQDIGETLRFPKGLLSHLDVESELLSPDFLSAVRPDGFLQSDRFVLSEYNLGSGLLATLSYTEVLHDLFNQDPCLSALHETAGCLERPFRHYLTLLRERAGPKKNPELALFSPALEQKDIYSWEMELFEDLLRENGFSVSFVDEHSMTVDRHGDLREDSSGKKFDLLLQMTTGEFFLDNFESLASDHQFLCGSHAGSAPHLHPLSCLLLGKGCLPRRLGGRLNRPSPERGFLVQQDESHFPDPERASEYRLNKDDFVIKRSWSGKDTLVGRGTGGRAWNRIVAEAIDSAEFIVQRYQPLPKIELPFLIEGDNIVNLPVRFELSPFIIQGKYAGALVRYAPDAEGIRLSPSPPGMGLTVVYSI
jgi:hypothetical protein